MLKSELIDTHQHLWVPSAREYSWLTPEFGLLNDDFTPERLASEIETTEVTGIVLVQAADSYEDTFYMLDVADHYPIVQGVVAWVPLDRPNEARASLALLAMNKYVKGIRNLTHDYTNPKYESDDAWILRREVLETISVIEQHGFSLDYVCTNSEHIANIPILAVKFPTLRIVIDHLAKPNIKGRVLEPWATLMSAAARHSNVYVKLSGLSTASDWESWSYSDWQPYVNHVVTQFGAGRIMMGGDWPVATLAGDYGKVWRAQLDVISRFSRDDQERMRSRTAKMFYNL